MAEGDDKGKGNGDDKGKGDGGAEALKELLTPMVDSIKGIQDGMKGLADEVTSIKEAQGKVKDTDDDDKDKDKDLDDRTLESLSRKDFMGHIVEQFGKLVDAKIKPVATQLDDGQTKQLEADVAKAVKKAEADHEDFWDWKEEMGKELQKNPYLYPEDAYVLAKAKDPGKAKELETKHLSEDEKKKIEEAKKKKDQPQFGGLTPTSGKTVESTKMKQEEASELAWNETMGDTGEK